MRRVPWELAALPALGIARLLPETGWGLWARLAAATACLLLPGALIARALRVPGFSAVLAWSLGALFAAMTVVFVVHTSLGLALILVVWINYFSRVILYAAAWAWTHPLARAERVAEPADPVQGPPSPSAGDVPGEHGRSRKGAFAAGAAVGVAAATAIARAGRHDDS